MELSAAANRSLTASRPPSLLWVQEDVAGSLMSPKGKEKGRKEGNKSNKKRKQQQQPVQQSHKGVDSKKVQAWEAGTYDGDKDMVMDYTTTLDNNSNRSHSVIGRDLDLDTAHTASPRQEIARVKHNKVEQKYRNRLNAHFEALLDVLPPSTALPSEQGFEANNTEQPQPLRESIDMVDPGILGKERRVSKSEVLDRARLYIQTLENEHKRLSAERKQLRKMWDEYGNAQ
ncbi:hypothetical protein N0V85_005969 [Neurospora sp. IMI 360204]|nr:hypothetical protein N0V85_005969 [Neurospora sp. IMI 360204]